MPATIAWKTQGEPRVGSAHYRALLPCRYLREDGWPCEIYDARNDAQYRLVVFQKIYDETTLQTVKRLKARGTQTVFDLCDNLFHYDLDNPSAVKRRTENLNRMIETVDRVSVSTPTLASIIHDRTGRDCEIIDDAVAEPRLNRLLSFYHRLRERPLPPTVSGRCRVVWYGVFGSTNPPYGMIDLQRVIPALCSLNEAVPLSLSVISNSRELCREYTKTATFPVQYYEWDRASFPYVFQGHDVCVIPVNQNPLTLCKTSNRVILSLLLGVPVIADRIPSYEEFSPFVLFSDWEKNLRTYATAPELRQRHVAEGQRYIRSSYNRERAVLQWSTLFRSLLDQGSTAPQRVTYVSDAQKS